MKKLMTLVTVLIMLSSCDSPRSQRAIISSKSNGLATDTKTGVDLGAGTPISEADTTTVDSKIPTDAKHCKFSTDGINGFASTSVHLNSYTLCQSSTDKNVFYIQIKIPPIGQNGDVSICFIPQTTSGADSIYVGNSMCSTFKDPKEVKKITFVKFTQYSNALINSVLFFKDTYYFYPMYNKSVMTMDAYKDCMYRASLIPKQIAYCNSFKSVGQYVIQSF